jgi:pectate lyase
VEVVQSPLKPKLFVRYATTADPSTTGKSLGSTTGVTTDALLSTGESESTASSPTTFSDGTTGGSSTTGSILDPSGESENIDTLSASNNSDSMIIAIAASVAAALCLLCAIMAAFLIMRRKKRRNEERDTNTTAVPMNTLQSTAITEITDVTIKHKLGAGSFGEVYLVCSLQLNNSSNLG